MKKKLLIICDTETTIRSLLNTESYEVYEAPGEENIITMIKKDDQPTKEEAILS
jgi:hypothetical protein